ncbi:hypothetical protein GCM10007100_22000 [Roseibacillus persicicus]|uniref:NlpC/P60 domain-containing protein n=2 Tax=Roseibacillus persicicus TaxID=454148 RepID=A0A918TMN2_9BACT|nr:hypothetical protein GCM10007100_22000 [Roseibacillus persicicus]
MKALLPLFPILLLACSAPSQTGPAHDFNTLTLTAINDMPTGGGYSGSDATKNKLTLACTATDGGLSFSPTAARPSFCSGATYLVFLKALQESHRPSPALAKTLVVAPDQKDGHGIFGRWNANGPGCAKLVADLGCGVNFTSWESARPGDFLKIWWTNEIGGKERGHHVVYLGHDQLTVRFWSSNQPGGFGEKSVPRADCKRVLFTRITSPQAIARATQLPASDPWLERMLKEDFTWQEVVTKCRVNQPRQVGFRRNRPL